MKTVFFLVIMLCFWSCVEEEAPLTAEAIVKKSIEAQCNGNCDHATINFTFRKNKYTSIRDGGAYRLERIILDSISETKDVLSNKGFQRLINNEMQEVADTTAIKLGDAVNSVHYFAQVPFGLEAPAVRKKLLGKTKIKEQPYYEVEITFSEEGGGTDFDDVFIYWIHTKKFTVDYLAYKYAVNGGGIRFREAYNERRIEQIRFVDYNNFKPESLTVSLQQLPKLFEKGELKLLSKIETEDISVRFPKH
ncbi:DUF6503 family protein [Cochleicola gelatinilyticus]|nr:DUF6503 family protein [Cochleicola gelatinilyticus]